MILSLLHPLLLPASIHTVLRSCSLIFFFFHFQYIVISFTSRSSVSVAVNTHVPCNVYTNVIFILEKNLMKCNCPLKPLMKDKKLVIGCLIFFYEQVQVAEQDRAVDLHSRNHRDNCRVVGWKKNHCTCQLIVA